MKAVTWHGKRDVRVETVPDPTIEEPTDAIIEVTLDQHLRVRPAPVRGARRVHEARRHPRPRADGHRAGGRQRGHQPRGRRPRRDPVPDLLRQLLHVRPAAVHPVRDHAGARPGHGCRAVRLLRAVRRGARRPGRTLRVPQAQFTHIKVPGGPAGLALRLPLRRAAHRLAGRRSTPTFPTAAR